MKSSGEACARCGALNGATFDRCVRCGAGLSGLAGQLDLLRRPIDGAGHRATLTLGGLTALVFAGQMLSAAAKGHGLLSRWPGVDYVRFGALLSSPDLPFEPWRLLSAVFVHGGPLHFGMNMLALASFAAIAEPALGSARFVLVYATTGVLGFLTSLLWNNAHGDVTFTVGASGAIFGVTGLILGWLVRRRIPGWKRFAVRSVLLGLLFGFAANAANMGIRIDNAAHVGGLASGVLFGLFYGGRGPRRGEILANAAGAITLLACVVAIALCARSPIVRAF